MTGTPAETEIRLLIRDGLYEQAMTLLDSYLESILHLRDNTDEGETRARDAIDDVLMALIQSHRQGYLDQIQSLLPWCAKVAIRAHIKRRLGNAAWSDLGESTPDSSLLGPDAVLLEAELRNLIMTELGAMTPRMAEVMLLTIRDGLRPSQIAARLKKAGRPRSGDSIRYLQTEGRNRLRKTLLSKVLQQ